MGKKILFIVVTILTIAGGLYFLKPEIFVSIFRKPSSQQKALCENCNVLLISLDTCAAKHMECYGYSRNTAPNFCQLAKEGIFFKNAYANATWTLPSHVSMLSGLYPSTHKVLLSGDRLSSDIRLLPELLHERGYTTHFFIPEGDFTLPVDTVYNKGIDHYVHDEYDTPEYFQRALDVLEHNEEKQFVFFHNYFCHGPYFIDTDHPKYTTLSVPIIPIHSEDISNRPFDASLSAYLLESIPKGLANGQFRTSPDAIHNFLVRLKDASNIDEAISIYDDAVRHDMWGEWGMMYGYIESFRYWNTIDIQNPKHIEFVKALYDQRLSNADGSIIGALRKKMHDPNFLKKTIVIITADHGEEFMEHGSLTHVTLFDDNLRIPLIILMPGFSGISVKESIQSVDIVPTLLEALGIRTSIPFNGKSLVPLFSSGFFGSRLLIAKGHQGMQPTVSVIREGVWKVFITAQNNTILPFALYNTEKDSEEQTNILPQHMRKAEQLINQYKITLSNIEK